MAFQTGWMACIHYTFMFFLVVAAAATGENPNVHAWMGIEVIGGAMFMAGILGIVKILGSLAMRKAAQTQ